MVVNDEVSKKEKELEGTKKSGKQIPMYTLLRVSCGFRFRRL